jgi:hypothetical protein
MQLKAGTRLQSTTCDTQVVVVKAPKDEVDVRCGGQPMVAVGEDADRVAPSAAHASGTLLGKRYVNDDAGIELLCSKAGEGSLSIGDEPVQLKDAKALPSSD